MHIGQCFDDMFPESKGGVYMDALAFAVLNHEDEEDPNHWTKAERLGQAELNLCEETYHHIVKRMARLEEPYDPEQVKIDIIFDASGCAAGCQERKYSPIATAMILEIVKQQFKHDLAAYIDPEGTVRFE